MHPCKGHTARPHHALDPLATEVHLRHRQACTRGALRQQSTIGTATASQELLTGAHASPRGLPTENRPKISGKTSDAVLWARDEVTSAGSGAPKVFQQGGLSSGAKSSATRTSHDEIRGGSESKTNLEKAI